MNDDLKLRVLALSEREFQVFLASLIHNLTVTARSAYPHVLNNKTPPDKYEKWQWINELIHGASQQIRDHVKGNPLPVSDSLSLDMLLERSSGRGEKELKWAIATALGDNPRYPNI